MVSSTPRFDSERSRTERPRLGELLARSGHLTEDQVAIGLREQSSGQSANGNGVTERIGHCLMRLGLVSEECLLDTLSEQLRIERVPIEQRDVADDARDALPLDFVREHQVLPLEVTPSSVVIATADPARDDVIEDVRLLTGLEVEEVLAPKRAIAEKIADCYDLTVERLLEGIEDGEHRDIAASDTLHEIEVMASEPTVVNLVNAVISGALKERASDIHLVPFERGTELRYRIDGVLHEIPPPPRHLHAAFISRIKIMAEMNIAERFIPQDGNFQIQHGGRRVDVRVGTMPTIHGESVVLRLLEKGSRIQTLVELGLDEERSASLDRLLDKPYGIFLSTGPTGSGKTTTLYSILSGIYTTERKILTLEDPVEYQLPGVTQIPVKPSRGFTFATGLRAILRQDPDVIMVGEIRDSETAEIAIRAALTGHLVFSTLHTNDAAGAVTRLVDMGVEPFLIASSLEAALAQRLVRTICTTCREPVAVDDTTRKKIETIEAADRSIELSGVQLFRGAGCAECRQTGYRGRTGLYEILVLVPELRQMVLDKRPSTEIKRAALESMQTLRQSGLAKVQQGATTIDEILRVAMGDS